MNQHPGRQKSDFTLQREARGPAVPGGSRFRRGLLWFSVIFSLLLVADVAVVGNLIFRDLSRQVIEEAKARSLAEAVALARSVNLDTGVEMAGPAAVYRMVRDTYAVASYAERLLRRYTFIERIRVVDEQGRAVMPPRYRRAELTRRPDSENELQGELQVVPDIDLADSIAALHDLEADHGLTDLPETVDPQAEIPGTRNLPPVRPAPAYDDPVAMVLARMQGIPVPDLTLGPGDPATVNRVRRAQSIYKVTAASPAGGATVEISLSEEVLRAEIDQLRQDLIIKILIGAAISLVLIVVAYIFVVKLFNKTRRLETEAQMADRLAYVGTLAAGLAHEIRNPLSAMKLNLQMLDTGSHQPDEESRDLLHDTQSEVDRLGGLVTSFLSYARPARIEKRPAQINALVNDMADFLRADAQQRGVEIETGLAGGLPVIALDARQVRQALLNIVHNAVAAVETGGGGTVWLRTASGSAGEVLLEIEDDGPGIPEEKMDSIFQVFYSSKPGGTGLGLPIAQRVMEGHGGRIQVESRPGSGTRFTLVFPRRADRRSRAAL
jgi:signal transduction histidine kinase